MKLATCPDNNYMLSTKYTFMKALVLGGTGFIGRRLVANLLSRENEVTLATSGKSSNPFGNRVSTIQYDRFQGDSAKNPFSELVFHDVVFDMTGYRSIDMKNSLEAIGNSIGRYVYVSSAAVYRGMAGTLSEEQFDPSTLEVSPGLEESYDAGKRASEAFLVKNSPVPLSIARFPNVMGHDDSTLRFQDHVSRILRGEEFRFREPEGRRNCVWVEDAGRFLAWLGEKGNEGIYNAASPDFMKASELINSIALALDARAAIHQGTEESNSRYAAGEDFILSVKKARQKGFEFTPTEQWLPGEAQKARDTGLTSPNSMKYAYDLFP